MFVVFVNKPLIVATATDCDNPPVNPVPVGVDQVYNVPAGTTPFVTSVGVTLNITPLQVVVLIGLIMPTGLIVTVTVNVDPDPQLTVLGVTI